LLGALLSTAGTYLNVAVIYKLWADGQTVWFALLVVFVGVNCLLNLLHSAAYGGVSLLKSVLTLLQLHHFANAIQCISRSEKTEQYVGGRLFQAVLEAGPGCILQLYINLNDHVDRDALRNLSVVVSMLTIATTLAWDTSPVDTQPMERPFIFMYCSCEVISTVISMSMFALLYRGYTFVGVGVHFIIIVLSWRWWSRSMVGRRCELFRMGLFAGFLNIVTTVHTGEDSSFVYECVKAPATEVPHFIRGGSRLGSFIGLATVQDVARVGYIAAVLIRGVERRWHIFLVVVMAGAFVVQHVALAIYWIVWRKRAAEALLPHGTLKRQSWRGSPKGEGSNPGDGATAKATPASRDVLNPILDPAVTLQAVRIASF